MQIRALHLTLAAIAATIMVGLLGYLIFYGDGGWRELDAMKKELIDITDENQQIESKNIQIYRKIDRLKNDPEYIENTARQELKLIRENEIVFTVKPSD